MLQLQYKESSQKVMKKMQSLCIYEDVCFGMIYIWTYIHLYICQLMQGLNLYCKNIHDSVDDMQLKEYFSSCGLLLKLCEPIKESAGALGLCVFPILKKPWKPLTQLNGMIYIHTVDAFNVIVIFHLHQWGIDFVCRSYVPWEGIVWGKGSK